MYFCSGALGPGPDCKSTPPAGAPFAPPTPCPPAPVPPAAAPLPAAPPPVCCPSATTTSPRLIAQHKPTCVTHLILYSFGPLGRGLKIACSIEPSAYAQTFRKRELN